MITRLLSLFSSGLLATCLFVSATLGADAAQGGGDTSYQVLLVWGTDGETPKDKPLTELDSKLQEKLKGIFKWKNYFEVSRKPLTVAKESSQKLKLSDKCEIQVQDMGNARAEIRLFGEGTLVKKIAQTIVPGELIVLAGNSKGDTAWFVVLIPSK